MKRILIVAALMIAGNANAQGLYLRIGGGYAIPAAGQTVDGNGIPFSGSINNTAAGQRDAFQARKVSFSSGVTGVLALGYMFNRHIGVEANAAICLAPQEYSMNGQNVFSPSGAYLVNQSMKTKSKTPTFITPSVVLQTDGKTVNGYARFGVAIPVGGTIIQTQDNTYINVFQTKEHMETDFKMNFGIGFAAAIGAEYKVGNIGIFLEGSSLSMARYVKTATIKEHTVGDVNTTPPVAGTVIQYTSTGSYSTAQPTYAMPFSNFGLTIGVHFNLSQPSSSNNTK